ncbi:MAG: glycosyltransferase family 2 protein [Anaerolineales bacterium]|nr:glycosyltransferase family 2 protein [Anaerolineales bacterium]
MELPTISIIVPCYNEQTTIRQLLEAIYHQTYPRTEMEVVIADGLSEDATRDEVVTFQREHPDLAIHTIDNIARTIPSAINCAIRAARGETIIRMDAHSRPYPDYVERCIIALDAGLGDSVGGIWEIKPGGKSWMAASIAVAAAHPLGVGDAGYRIGARASAVDTVPFGAFRRTLIDKVGLFDESLLSNEDYEFNTRIRQSGGRVWLDPKIVTVYYARPTLRELARQYWRYGYWKFHMLRRYPNTLRWRQALPPLFVASLIGLLLFVWWPLAAWLLALELTTYATVLLLAGVLSSFRQQKLYHFIGLPLSIATMHLAWGGGFLWSILMSTLEKRRNG